MATMEWNKEKTLILIREFHQRPGLWNMTHEDYRKKEAKKVLLSEIALKFDNCVTGSDIEKKFHTLRTQYHREINRMNSGNGPEPYKSKWFAFNHLQFLNDPSACRSNKETRRRSSITPKVVYLSNLKVDESSVQAPISFSTPTGTIHNVQVSLASKDATAINNSMSIRKDLRVLFEETIESEDDKNEDEQVADATTMTTATVYEHEESGQHDKGPVSNNCSYEEEHLVEETGHHHEEQERVVEEVEKYQVEPSAKIPKMEHCASNFRRNNDYYSDIVYETASREVHPMTVVKKVYKDAETLAPQRDTARDRDEFSTFGEYVANELRFITDRQILISCKHKINTALFEASLAQVQQNGNS